MVQVNRFRLNFRCHGDILPYLRGIAECLNKAIFQVDSLEVFYQSNYSTPDSFLSLEATQSYGFLAMIWIDMP